jgi:Mce-associated membrane protein
MTVEVERGRSVDDDETPRSDDTACDDTELSTDSSAAADALNAVNAADAEEDAPSDETTGDEDESTESDTATASWPTRIARAVAFVVLPVLAILLAGGIGFLKWQCVSSAAAQSARTEASQAAKEATIAMLSYHPDTVDKELAAARDRLTGTFKDSYTSLTNDVVIPGAKQRKISAVATVPAVASVSANAGHAVVMLYVDQTVLIGDEPPTDTASVVRVTLQEVGKRWLVSQFDPI